MAGIPEWIGALKIFGCIQVQTLAPCPSGTLTEFVDFFYCHGLAETVGGRKVGRSGFDSSYIQIIFASSYQTYWGNSLESFNIDWPHPGEGDR